MRVVLKTGTDKFSDKETPQKAQGKYGRYGFWKTPQ
jgi:hypothetical protein